MENNNCLISFLKLEKMKNEASFTNFARKTRRTLKTWKIWKTKFNTRKARKTRKTLIRVLSLCRKPIAFFKTGLESPFKQRTFTCLGAKLDEKTEFWHQKILSPDSRPTILTLSLKVLDIECQIRENTSKLLSKHFKTFSLPVYLLINLGSLFQPRGVVVCILACRSQFTKIIVSDFL